MRVSSPLGLLERPFKDLRRFLYATVVDRSDLISVRCEYRNAAPAGDKSLLGAAVASK